ncbi:MAG: PQQ-binding-like beta-propeller repeat protein [Planctomycetota bacterium]|nr:PQQ-binding-like beta-propeller repeat protein [Planctomycetota bacterium]
MNPKNLSTETGYETGGPEFPNRSWLPPLWLILVDLLGLPIIFWALQTEYFSDATIGNIVCWITAFLILVSLMVWFLFFSRFSCRTRTSLAAFITTAIVLFFVLFRLEGTTGTLKPTAFVPRWRAPRDEHLGINLAKSTEVVVDIKTSTPHDFPQFLGPERSASLDRFQLDFTSNSSNPWKEVWRQPIGGGWSGFAAVNGFAITMEQRGAVELVSCYEIASGKLMWIHETSARHETLLGGAGPRGTPTIDEGRVFALGATGVLRCLDGATGKLIWQSDLAQRYGQTVEAEAATIAWGRASSPLIADELVIVPAGGTIGQRKSLVAFNKVTGDIQWEAGDYQVSYSSPVRATLNGIDQIVTVMEDHVVSHATQGGRSLWEHPWPGKSYADANVSQPIVLPDNHVFLSKGYGGGGELLRIAGSMDAIQIESIYHHHNIMRTKFTNACSYGDFLYGLDDGILSCVAWRTGERNWKQGRYGHGQVLRLGTHLLVQSESGEIVILKASSEKHEVLLRFHALTGKTWNCPCVFGHLLLLRNGQEAACFEIPSKPSSDG